MLEKILKYKFRILAVCLFVILLAIVRAFEDRLFYDPFLAYFKGEYLNKSIPDLNKLKLFLSLLVRFALNTIISLAIIQTLFRDVSLTKFALLLFCGFFVIFIIAFYAVLLPDEPNKMYVFYIRRFLIQPLLLLLFVPAFYFQKSQANE